MGTGEPGPSWLERGPSNSPVPAARHSLLRGGVGMASRGSSSLRALPRTTAFRATVLALCVALLSAGSSLFVFPPESNSVLWLPGGLMLAVLVRARPHRWPAYLAANFLAHLAL